MSNTQHNMKNTIKYVANWLYTPRDTSGNVYSYFVITDTGSGRRLMGRDAPESNVRGTIFELSGKEWKRNYIFSTSQISSRSYDYAIKNVPYIGTNPEEIASAFRKMMRSRKKGAGQLQ